MSSSETPPSITRRQMLAGTSATALGASSGCIQRVRSIFNRDSPAAASVSIVTSPADDDELATKIANEFAANLNKVGIDTEIKYLPYVELYREVLLNRDFGMFISRLPHHRHPDSLRGLLHSAFASEPGWQNPYRFANITLDDALDAQRTASAEGRGESVADAIQQTMRVQPFATIGYQYPIRGVYTNDYTGWNRYPPWSPLSYYGLERTSGSSSNTLKISVTDARVTQNLNPLSVEYRKRGTFTGLLYDPLVYRTDSDTIPWLATDIDWTDAPAGTVAAVSLRDDLQWHDGESLTAEDVEFTYRFLSDTSLGEMSVAAVAPRFRGETSLVQDVAVLDDETVRFTFGETSKAVAERALTVPILPAHRWRDQTGQANLSGVNVKEGVTDALVLSKTEPVGSGPLEFDNLDDGTTLKLVRNNDHFFNRNPPTAIVEHLGDGLAFGGLEIQTAPSHATAIEVLSNGGVDATAATVSPKVVPKIEDDARLSLFVHETDHTAPYHVGFNTAKEPFSNPYFRRLVARLLDKSYIADEIFEGYGQPAANPFDGTAWNPDEAAFNGSDPEVPFLGSGGNVDVDAARDAFGEHGFDFNDDGSLVLR